MSVKNDIRKFELEINESKKNGETLSNLVKLEKQTASLRQENEQLEKVMAHLAAKGQKNTEEYKRMEAQLKNNKKTVRENNEQMKGLRKTLDYTHQSANQLRKRSNELRSTLNGMSKAANPQEYARLEKELSQVNGQLDTLKGKGQQTQSMFGKLKGAANGMLPAFGWTAIIAGAVALGKKLFDITKQTMENRQEVQKLTGLMGKSLADTTAQVEATAQTFDKDFNETLIASNAYAKSMGISHKESMDLISKGFIAGADSGGEFLDMVKEYGPQFKAAGVDAESAIAIMTQSVKEGVFSDKGADTIKEGMLRLREMPQATKDALDAIGISSDQMQQDLERGNITVFQAMQQVSNKLGELPPQSSEVGQAIADIFGGPGEDAGLEFIKTIGKVQGGLDQLVEQTGETGKAQQQLLEANNKLSKAWSDLIGQGTGTFTKWKAASKTFIAEGLTGMVSGIQKLRNWFIDLYNNSLPFRALIGSIGLVFKSNVNIMVTAAKYLWNNTKTIFKVIGAALKGDFGEIKKIAKEGFAGASETFVDGWEKGKTMVADYVDEMKNGKIEMKSIVKLTTEAATAQETLNEKQKESIEHAKDLVKEVQELIDQSIETDLAGELLDIESESAKITANLSKGTEESKKATADAKKIVDEAKSLREEADALLYNDMPLQDQQDAEIAFYQQKKDAMLISETQFQAFKDDIDKNYTQKRLQRITDYMSAAQQLTGSLTTFTEAAENRKLNAIQKQVEGGIISEEEGTRRKEIIQKEYAEKQKKIAIANAIIGGAQAVVQLWANQSTIPSPANEIYKGVMTAVIAGTTLAQVSKIRSQGFADGGHTGRGSKYEYAGAVHKGEYVIPQEGVNNPQLKPVIDYMEIARRNGTLSNLMNPFMFAPVSQSRGFAEGGYTSSTNNISGAAVQDSGKMMELMLMQINTLTELNGQLSQGIKAYVDYYGSNGMKNAIEKDAEMQNRLSGG